ncbi:UNKNOWN [Stylonychia lemnae]|uniref:Uncharacterized protein n=1 Tax=Stylonychia lemnae TaxID=5949 RepID=A0A078A151_STYLE|nr:UNKNOWN [Stylonychia lemnae]|eukprot:CDW75577.1 UNKNOWN [Stylonychia lemnae]
MRSILAKTLLGFTIAATCTQAYNPFVALKNKFLKSPRVQPKGDDWPDVHWPLDYQMHGAVYTFDEAAKELKSYQNTTLDIYFAGTQNRQKVITHTYVQGLNFTEIISFSDFAVHKQYTKIPKIEKCDTTDLPADFNLTDLTYKFKNQSSGLTQYLGEKTLPWTGDDKFYAFHLSVVNETVYFCQKCKELKWVTFDSSLIINTPEGQTDRVFTDADFDGATCQNHNKNHFNLFSYFNLKMFI